MGNQISKSLIAAADELRDALRTLSFSAPVTHTYLPLDYAWEQHCDYLTKFGNGKKRVLLLGMNPGPFGMAQTGVPFGEIAAVRDWMKISGEVSQPKLLHPKRPILGFSCEKSEVSGRRLWGLFAEKYPRADDFFAEHFVVNYCPLVWMSSTGANITPDKVSTVEMKDVERACMEHLGHVIELLDPKFLVGVGAYAEQKLREANHGDSRVIGKILHPSPASPAANRDWAGAATRQLHELGVW